MRRYAALLGSINVGGNRLKMDELSAALEDHGFANVATVVASGNVLFDHPQTADAKLEDEIASLVRSRFGIATFATVRTQAELTAALEESPFAGVGEDKFVHVHFLSQQPTKAQFDKLIADHEGRGREKLAPGIRALHIDFVDGVGTSKLTGAFIEKRLGSKGTARNVRSIKRIIEKLG
ncbi:DUF1697 domain-containing protein [Erythrobacteraceae bacterium CFH 75059]|uniref:DUF1697 domain-containing protein n=1 Tax=Qipengyuania thermophila TaxID=2509361 RepID=UPI00102276A3|nr:DUF1697 domain-containing protein [Qipengyuania thermophila]TCD04770.1 DUF1697 domain-containing protein [Erythrobacteraceae bacterium CFH 75059]